MAGDARQEALANGARAVGYQWVDRQLVPHPEEPPIRKLMYELFSEHRRKKTVARILNKVGFSKLYHRKTPQTIKS